MCALKAAVNKYYFWKESSKINRLSIFSKTEPNFLDIFRVQMGKLFEVSTFYVLNLITFWGKKGKLFKGGYYSRENTD